MKKPATGDTAHLRKTDTPRTDNLIADMIEKRPGDTPKAMAAYFEAVHQELAPLARELEKENQMLRQLLGAADNKLQAIGKYHGGVQATAINGLREKIRPALDRQETP